MKYYPNPTNRKKILVREDYLLTPISKITFSDEMLDVGNFTTEDGEYLVSNATVHNCPFYSEGDNKNQKLCDACLNDKSTLTGFSRRREDPVKIQSLIKQGASLTDLRDRYVKKQIDPPDNICLYWSLKGSTATYLLMTYPYIVSEEVRRSAGIDELIEHSLLIVDEAHSLEGTTSLSDSYISLNSLVRVKEQFESLLKSGNLSISQQGRHAVENVLRSIADVVLKFGDSLGMVHKDRTKLSLAFDLLSDEIESIRAISELIQERRLDALLKRPELQIADPFFRTLEFIEQTHEESLELFSSGSEALVLKLVDPAEILQFLNKARGLLLMSGTFPSTDYVKKVWGIRGSVESVDVVQDYPQDYYSVFPRDAKRFEIMSNVSSEYKGRNSGVWDRYAKIIDRAFIDSQKHILVGCSSYHIAEQIFERVKVPKLCEDRNTAHQEIMEKLLSPGAQYALICVVRGKLLEGVEFIDRAAGLSIIDTVIIAGIPFAVPDDYYRFRAKRILTRLGYDAEKYRDYKSVEHRLFSLQPAIVAIKQAIGRGIRTPKDRIRVILADERFDNSFWRRELFQ